MSVFLQVKPVQLDFQAKEVLERSQAYLNVINHSYIPLTLLWETRKLLKVFQQNLDRFVQFDVITNWADKSSVETILQKFQEVLQSFEKSDLFSKWYDFPYRWILKRTCQSFRDIEQEFLKKEKTHILSME